MNEWALQLEILGRAGIAAALGAVVGLERELKGRPAGIRTHLLVAAAAALFVALGVGVVGHFEASSGDDILRADPLRILSAIVTGISFIGAGTIIFRSRADRVEGITTAASILFTSAIGLAVGLRLYLVGAGCTLAVVALLYVIGRVEPALKMRFGTEEAREQVRRRQAGD